MAARIIVKKSLSFINFCAILYTMAIYVTIDSGRVKYAFGRAPTVFADEIDHWLNRERLGFIGKRGRPDSTRGIKGGLYKKETASGQQWSPRFVEQLAGIKNNKGKINSSLVMGLIGKDAKLHSTMEFLEQGGIVNSGKFMPIPNLENLKYYGVHNQKQAAEFYKTTFDNPEFQLLPGKDGNYYLVSRGESSYREHTHGTYDPWETAYSGQNIRKLLFTLSRKAKIHKQYDFTKRWAKRLPSVMKRGEQAIYRATRKTEKLINEGKLGLF